MNRKIKRILIFFAVLFASLSVALYFYTTHQVEGNYFQSDGAKIHYTDEGKGVPVILVHGFAANSDLNWRRPGLHKRLLKEGFRVVTMDMRGHGKSGKPHDTGQYGAKMAHDVANLTEHLEIEKAHLVGYSLGGFVALKCAALYPDKWLTLTAMASGWEDANNSTSFDKLEQAIHDFQSGKPVGPVINYFDETGNNQTGFLHTQWFKILIAGLNDRGAMIAILQNGRGLGISTDEVAAIQIPVCGIVGTKDPILSKAQALARMAPHHKLIMIEEADHITTMTSAKAQNSLVEFLKNPSAP